MMAQARPAGDDDAGPERISVREDSGLEAGAREASLD